jgi:predicted nucleic acid-binding Zn ribbon protein
VTDAGPTRVGDLLSNLLEKRGLGIQIRRIGALEAWSDAVGEGISQVTAAKSVVASTLFIEVRSSAWLMELSLMKEALLERVNVELGGEGTIDRIVLTLMEGDGSRVGVGSKPIKE